MTLPKLSTQLPSKHEGRPYCQTPCYATLFGHGWYLLVASFLSMLPN